MKPTKLKTFKLDFSVVTAVCIGLCLSIILFLIVRNNESERIDADFRLATWDRIYSIKREVENNLEVLQSIYSLFESSGFVTRNQFKVFCKSALLHHPDIQALEWIPRVSNLQREDHEKKVQVDGYPNYQITRREKQGKMVRADENKEYFPVYYMEPYKGNETALGFDLATNQKRLEALNHSRDTGEMIATSRITLVQEEGNQYGFLVFLPVYGKQVSLDTVEERRSDLIGFVLGVFRIGDIVETALSYFERKGIDIHLFDMSSPQDERFLYFHPSRLSPDNKQPLLQQEADYDGMYVSHTIKIVGRKWSILCKAIPEFIEHRQTWYPWGLLAGGLMLTCLLAVYLTVQRKASQKTQRINEQLQISIEQMPVGYILWNREFCVLEWNHAAERIFGYSKSEVLGKFLMDIIVPEDIRQQVGKVIENLQEGKVSSYSEKNNNIRKDGKLISCQWHNTPLKSGTGKTVVILSMIEDITEKKKMEEVLLQSEKLKSIGTITAGVSHEFNNLLSIISGNVQLLEESREDDEGLMDALRIIKRATNDGAEISRRMLKFTKTAKDTEGLVPFDIKELINQAIDFTTPRWKNMAQAKGINYHMDTEGMKRVPSILCNPTELREVFVNIINNALDAMPDDGRITFRTWSGEDTVFISISDTGEGMPEEVKKNIFDPFFTTKVAVGTGLGMSTAYGIITGHGGKIEVESKVGRGSTFTLQFPTAAKADSPEESPVPKQEIKTNSLRILVVDNEEEICKMLDKFLSKKGHLVRTVDNGREAIELSKSEDFDLVLCDLAMPNVYGYDIIKAFNDLEKRPKIGIITGWGEKLKSIDDEDVKVDFIIKKPFDFSEITKNINDVFGAE